MSMGGRPKAKAEQRAEEQRPLKVQISIPSGDGCKTDFALSLAELMRYTTIEYDNQRFSFLYGIANSRGSNLAGSRNLLVATALRDQADYLWFVDSDMSFPPDTLCRLLAAAEINGLDIIGCTGPTRQQGAVCRDGGYQVREDGARRSINTMQTTGIHEVDRMGTGVLLIRTSIFRSLPRPWFMFPINDSDDIEEMRRFEGEDHYFCRKAREAGFKIWIDFDLSKEIGHVGSFKYTADEAADLASIRTLTPEQMYQASKHGVRVSANRPR